MNRRPEFAAQTLSELVRLHVSNRLGPEQRGELANEMLQRVAGEMRPMAELSPLFGSGDGDCLRTLTFVLSEVGLRSIEAMDWLDVLLTNEDDWIRHYAVVAVQHSGSLEHANVTAKALCALRDVRSVRVAAARFAARGSLNQIATAVPIVEGELGRALEWLVDGDYANVVDVIRDADLAVALVGVSAAHRGRVPLDADLLASRAELAEVVSWLDRRPISPSARERWSRIQALDRSTSDDA